MLLVGQIALGIFLGGAALVIFVLAWQEIGYRLEMRRRNQGRY